MLMTADTGEASNHRELTVFFVQDGQAIPSVAWKDERLLGKTIPKR